MEDSKKHVHLFSIATINIIWCLQKHSTNYKKLNQIYQKVDQTMLHQIYSSMPIPKYTSSTNQNIPVKPTKIYQFNISYLLEHNYTKKWT